MRKWIAVLAAVIVIAAVILAFAAGNNDKQSPTNETGNTNTSTTPNKTNTSSDTNKSTEAANKVSIANFAFSPATLTVKKGTTVTWTNNDSTTHTVTADSGNGPNSEQLAPGKTYDFTFNTVGTFNYHCSIHTSMHGTVTVTE
jgi:plastocyanin